MIDEETKQIIATYFWKGRMHDYKLFQRSRLKLGEHLQLQADWVIGDCKPNL